MDRVSKNKKNGLIYGYILGILGRLFFHEVSGLIFYTTYAGNLYDNFVAISAVLIYNASYVLTEGVITLILLALPPVRKMLENIKRLSVIH